MNKIKIYVGKVGQAYIDKETAQQKYNDAVKNVNDIEEILNIVSQYNSQANIILSNAQEANTLAEQIKNTLITNIDQYSNDEVIYNQLIDLKNNLEANDNDGDYTNGGNTETAQSNITFIENLISELNDINNLAIQLLNNNQTYLNQCEQDKENAIEVFKSYLPEDEENQGNESNEKESELLNRLDEVANGLENAQETNEAINHTSENVQNEINNIINGETPEPKPIDPEPVDNNKYFYVGTTKPASLSDASVVEEYAEEQTYTNNSGAKSHVFVLTNSDKNVTFINPELNVSVDQVAIDTTTVNRYNIFETAVGLANGSSIKIQIA